MPSRHVVVRVPDGLHARPVAELVRLAQAHRLPVTLTTDAGATVDLGSVLAVMDLGLASGDEVRLDTPASPAAERLLDRLSAVLDPA
ncbi:HPr family phosphocarrier protein [Microbacterium paludicola]|uniref:HPr family phosphocarrier protein n=1 Tax=Microbacterium paludicola TaxID=300019 RepID=UPI0011A0FEAE|nr:HPr family phosphocarrier protein [Microbacterium paludicola]